MLILNQKETAIIDSDGFSRFTITQDAIGHYHGYIIGAYTSEGKEPVMLGYYLDQDEAKEVLSEFFQYLIRGEEYYCFPQQADGFVFREKDYRQRKREQVNSLLGR